MPVKLKTNDGQPVSIFRHGEDGPPLAVDPGAGLHVILEEDEAGNLHISIGDHAIAASQPAYILAPGTWDTIALARP